MRLPSVLRLPTHAPAAPSHMTHRAFHRSTSWRARDAWAVAHFFSLFTALPAHAVTGRFDIGQAVSTAWRHLVGVCIAWLVFFLVYLLAMAVVYGVYTVNVMDEVLAMMETISTRTEDPFIMMRLYAETLPTDQDLPWMGLTSASVMLIMGVIMLMGRGVSAKLALAMPAPSDKAD